MYLNIFNANHSEPTFWQFMKVYFDIGKHAFKMLLYHIGFLSPIKRVIGLSKKGTALYILTDQRAAKMWNLKVCLGRDSNVLIEKHCRSQFSSVIWIF